MPDRYHLIVLDADVEGVTGHHKVQVRVDKVVEDGATVITIPGTAETYGIDIGVLQSVYGGDEQRWLREKVGREMVEKHKRREMVNGRLIAMKGEKIEIMAE